MGLVLQIPCLADGDHPTLFFAGAGEKRDVVVLTFQGPSAPGETLEVDIRFRGAIDEFCELGGSLAQDADGGSGIRVSLSDGAGASLRVSIKALSDLPSSEHHRVFVGAVTARSVLWRSPIGPAEVQTDERHVICRLASAVDPAVVAWDAPWLPDRFAVLPTKGGTTKRMVVATPGADWVVGLQVKFRITEAQHGWIRNLNEGRIFDFAPPVAAMTGDREVAKVAIDLDGEEVGGFEITGLAIKPVRTWWLNREGLLHELESLSERRWFCALWDDAASRDATAAGIKRLVSSTYGSMIGEVATEEEADIAFHWHAHAEERGAHVHGQILDVKLLREIRRLHHDPGRFGQTLDYLLGEVLLGGLIQTDLSQKRDIWIPLEDVATQGSCWFSDDFEIMKTAAHEMGHALGFYGHIEPNVIAERNLEFFDVMQQDYLPKKRDWGMTASRPWLRLVAGAASDGMKAEAIDLWFLPGDSEREGRFHWPLEGKSRTFASGKGELVSWWSGTGGGLPFPDSLHTDHDGDAVPLLLEYAFNLEPLLSDASIVRPEDVSGLPLVTREITEEGSALRFEFLCRRDPSLVYQPQVSLTLQQWFEVTDAPEIVPIDDAWDRVVVRQPIPVAYRGRVFGRVVVSFEGG